MVKADCLQNVPGACLTQDKSLLNRVPVMDAAIQARYAGFFCHILDTVVRAGRKADISITLVSELAALAEHGTQRYRCSIEECGVGCGKFRVWWRFNQR